VTKAARVRLLERAAGCYEQSGLPLDAARCREAAGTPLAAARLYEQAQDLEQAARCYDAANAPEQAVSCYLRLGLPDKASACWERAGDRLAAGWVLVTSARRFKHARWLLGAGQPPADSRSLRRAVACGLCGALDERDPDELLTALSRVERELASIVPASERASTVSWAVQAADLIGRHDLAAQVFAAAYRAGDRRVLDGWRDWAQQALGGTAGIPTGTVPTPRTGS